MKQGNASSVICGHKVPIKLEAKLYQVSTATRLAMLYGSKGWEVKRQKEQKQIRVADKNVEVDQQTYKNDISRNKCTQEKVGTASIKEKMIQNHQGGQERFRPMK